MLHAYVQRFDVTKNLEKFYKILETKQGPCVRDGVKNFSRWYAGNAGEGGRARYGGCQPRGVLDADGEEVGWGSVCLRQYVLAVGPHVRPRRTVWQYKTI